MQRSTSTFVAEFQLRTTAADERALRIRLDAGRQIYNAALGEALRRLDLMRESRSWQAARAMPKGKERNEAFKDLRRRFGFWGPSSNGTILLGKAELRVAMVALRVTGAQI
jgi:putative transposase